MARRWIGGAFAVMVFAGVGAAGAAAAPTYGGGLLSTTVSKPRHYAPSVGIVLDQRGERLAFRFDTTLACGHDAYQVSGKRSVPLAAGHAEARGASGLPLRGGRVNFSWTLAADVAGEVVSGVLVIEGNRRAGGRSVSCTRKPTRPFEARIARAPTGAPAMPAPGAVYSGLTNQQLTNGLAGAVLVRTTADGRRAAARWTAKAPCRRGPRELIINFTPATLVGGDGSFSRDERFVERFADALVRYHVEFGGRFQADGAAGTLRLRARVYNRRGRLTTRCDSGVRAWTAVRADQPAPATTSPTATGPGTTTTTRPATTPGPAPPPQPGSPPPPEQLWVNGTSWSLTTTSDPNDYIGLGESWSYSQADGQMQVMADPYSVNLQAWPGDHRISGGFAPPPHEPLMVGRTYTMDAHTAGDAAGGISADSRGCGSFSGWFVFDALDFAPDGTVRYLKVRWEQHCEGLDPALRGTLEFQA
ncbi:MAG TPA: hypothetical protein VE570_10195 [Thermoleophilaceae bacterium]|jgi:hypothetical protein|nr:hypothetical protein [Thermoleophilaceae bacterium]